MLLSASVALVSLAALPVAATAQYCGDNIFNSGVDLPCHCGDAVVGTKTLTSADPVTVEVCNGNGLVLQPGAILDLNKRTIRGKGAGVGVSFTGDDVQISNGAIRGFAIGILGFGHNAAVTKVRVFQSTAGGIGIIGDGAELKSSKIYDNRGPGVGLVGHGHRLEKLQVDRNRGNGIDIAGDGSTVLGGRVRDSQGVGAKLTGNNHLVTKLVVQGNTGGGIAIDGDNSQAVQNQAKSNSGTGFFLAGANHTALRNVATANTGDGFLVEASGSVFERNKTQNNALFGMNDETTGNGTAGTANTYLLNVCNGDRLGDSSDPSDTENLCR